MAPHQIQPASPLPWDFSDAEGRLPIVREVKRPHGEASVYEAVIKRRGTFDTVCRLEFGYGRGPRDVQDARYIVTACNLFPEMLEALKGLLGDIEGGLLVRDITRDGDPAWPRHMLDFVQRLQRAQSVLLKAEGRE